MSFDIRPGYREAGNTGRLGALISVGYYGFSWSVATSGLYGLDLNFGATALDPSSSDYRAHGLPLRCLSE